MSKYIISNFGTAKLKHPFVWSLLSYLYNRIHYVTNGVGYYIYNNKKIYFKPDHIYIIPRQFAYFPNYDNDSDFTHTFFDFLSNDVFAFDTPLEIPAKEFKSIYYAINSITEFFKDNNITKCSAGVQYVSKVTSMFEYLMFLIEQNYNIEYLSDTRISAVLEFIQTNYAKDISIDDMANLVFLEKNYFSKLFKKTLNLSPHQYLKQYRLSIGISHLQNGCSVSEAALTSGYSSIYSFSNAVKQHSGFSPRFWMNSNNT